ncbi:MAG: hypothetical protein SVO01_00420 [Thermotogota bacterium]|nr:hypothetical protein [Thermotogota bacterium]
MDEIRLLISDISSQIQRLREYADTLENIVKDLEIVTEDLEEMVWEVGR